MWVSSLALEVTTVLRHRPHEHNDLQVKAWRENKADQAAIK